jgi:sugar phosphate isomerase/epimerase
MRLCVLTDEISQDLDEVLEVCVRHGYPAIEVRSVWDTPPHQLTLRQCEEIAARARDHGVTVAGLASPVFKCALPEGAGDLARCADLLAWSLEQCSALGTGLLRIFSFLRSRAPDVPAAAAAMDSVLSRVPGEGVVLGVETGTRTNTPSASHTRQLLGLLERSGVGVVWDPGNAVFSGFGDGGDLDGLRELPEGLLVHVHVKDPLGVHEYVQLGRGTLAWPEILAALAERDYRGHVSLETHWRPGRVLTADERDRPWGRGFSAGGRLATEECMPTLASWVASVS